ncbi:MAG: NTP transferase domain-containing protein [bacterium]|nr:NTP transferase domain-containing protein [bacterium]
MTAVFDVAVAILAGGLATRLNPITERIPKALVEVAGRPFVFHQLDLLRREGIASVVLCVGHLGEMIREQVGDGRQFGLDVAYSFDGDKLLGTGGAVRHALPRLGPNFFVLYGDSYLDIAYQPVLAAFRESGLRGLMTVYRNEGQWDRSNVLFDGRRVVRYDKQAPTPDMCYIDYGLGLLSADILAERPAGEAFDLAEVYASLALDGQLAGYEAERRFYEIGTASGLAEADTFLGGAR